MSISKEKNGTYTLNYTRVDPITQKTHRTKKRGFRTRKEAVAYEKSLSRESSSVGFYSLYRECQLQAEQNSTTAKEKDALLEKYLPALKTMRYEDLTKPFLLQIRASLPEDLSAKTKNKILGIIKSTCKYANQIYDLPDNSKILKNFKIEKKEMQVWTMEQFQAFEDSIGDFPEYRDFFHLLFFTGMRKGEARALLVDDYDQQNMVITISKAMRRYKSSLSAPKTAQSKRKIKVDINTHQILLAHREHEKWLFGDWHPLNLNMIDKVFRTGTERAQLPSIRIHDLRHSHATYLINNGANIVAVSKRLGHSSINMTLQTYTHLLQNAEDELIEILNCSQPVATQTKKEPQ